MTRFFFIDPTDIKRLEKSKFVGVMNRLILAELHYLGLSANCAELCDELDIPDEGVDAHVAGVTFAKGARHWVPPGTSVWQYTTKEYGGPHDALEQLGKPGVKESMTQGATWVYALSRDLAYPQRRLLKQQLKAKCHELGVEPRFRIYTATNIANWAESHPVIACYIGKMPENLWSHEKWAGLRRYSGEYYEDGSRQNGRDEVIDFLRTERDQVHLRVEGMAGVGKTRFILECLRQDGLRQRVLYAREYHAVLSVSRGFFGWVRSSTPGSCILVVDECSTREARDLEEEAETCDGRVKVITIGLAARFTARHGSPYKVFRVEPLEDEKMRKLIAKQFPAMPREHIDYVVRMSQKFVKLAVALAQAISDQPDLLSAAALARCRDVDEILDRLFRDPQERKCMQAASLLLPIGWEGAVAKEKAAACKFVGVSQAEADFACEANYDQGFIAKKGDYRYVTPDILAAWLCSTTLEARKGQMIDFFEGLPSLPAQKAFLRRLSSLGDADLAKPILEQFLSPSGPFKQMEDIDSDASSRLLAMLAEADPDAGIQALNRMLGQSSRDELLLFNGGRRHVVWTLEKLVSWKQFFRDAARLLLALAEAENEECANNATGIWLQLFRPWLSGTELSGPERVGFLRHLYKTESSSQKRALIVLAASAALQRMTIHRSAEGEKLGGYAPRPEWYPRTQEELDGTLMPAFAIIESALCDSHETVTNRALDELTHDPFRFFKFGLGDRFIGTLDKAIPLMDETRKRSARDSLEFLLAFPEGKLPDQQRKTIEERVQLLTGDTFHDRLRRWVGTPTHADWRKPEDERHAQLTQEHERLAQDLLSDCQLLDPELDWLSSPEAVNSVNFGLRLGKRDADGALLPRLEAIAKERKAIPLLAGYVKGRAERAGRRWARDLLDGWAASQPELAPALLHASLLFPATGRAAARIFKLARDHMLDTTALQGYAFIGWARGLPGPSLSSCAALLLRDGTIEACEAAARLLAWSLEDRPGLLDKLRDVVWRVVESHAAAGTPSDWGKQWSFLAEAVASENPARAVNALLLVYQNNPRRAPTTTADRRLQFLIDVTKAHPAIVWPIVGDFLLKKGRGAAKLDIALKPFYAPSVPLDILLRWCEEHRADGPFIAATLCPVHGADRLADPAREILVHYGDDERVRAALDATFQTGTISGSILSWHESLLESVRRWKHDPDPNVKRWAMQEEESLAAQVEHWKVQEEEEDLELL